MRLIYLFWLLMLGSCEGPNLGCPGLRRACSLRWSDAESCGELTKLPYNVGRMVSPFVSIWMDPEDGCWPGMSGRPPEGWRDADASWCSVSLFDDPGVCDW